MKKIVVSLLALFVSTFAMSIISPVHAATLLNQYEFKGDLKDSLGKGDDLIVSNAATSGFGANGWSWTANLDPGTGLALTTPLANPANYTIGLRFKYTDVDGYRKIISFLSSSDDRGLYFYNGVVDQYSLSTGVKTFTPGTFYDLIMTRNASNNSVSIYMIDNGAVTNEINLTDSGLETVPNVVGGKAQFLLFRDDTSTNHEWTSGGTVSIIKVWDGALSQEEILDAFNGPTSVPAVSEWGMIVFTILAGILSIYYLKIRREV